MCKHVFDKLGDLLALFFGAYILLILPAGAQGWSGNILNGTGSTSNYTISNNGITILDANGVEVTHIFATPWWSPGGAPGSQNLSIGQGSGAPGGVGQGWANLGFGVSSLSKCVGPDCNRNAGFGVGTLENVDGLYGYGSDNIGVGYHACIAQKHNSAICIGTNAGGSYDDNGGIFIGDGSMSKISSGPDTVALGRNIMPGLTGYNANNTFIGSNLPYIGNLDNTLAIGAGGRIDILVDNSGFRIPGLGGAGGRVCADGSGKLYVGNC